MAEFLNNASWFIVGAMAGYFLHPVFNAIRAILINAINATIEEQKKQNGK